MSGHLHSVDEIVDMMKARIRELVGPRGWDLKGYEDGNDLVAYNPLRADRRPGSFRVCLRGPYVGLVKEFAGGDAWSPLSFTAELWFRGDNVQALRWARGWLGLDGTDPDSLKKTQRAIRAEAERDDPDLEQLAAKKRAAGYRIFLSAQTDIGGTPVARYLEGRAIDLSRLPFPLRALRFHPQLWNQESRRRWPAMVAPVVDAGGRFLGVHRTWLEVRPNGVVVKAPLENNKKVLGPYRGGIIRLWNGIRVDAETGEVRPGRKLRECRERVWVDVTEGIEDGMSVATSMVELRVAAGVSVDNMKNLRLPDIVEGVVFWKQRDAPGSPADKAFTVVVDNQIAQGKRVRLAHPPEGVKDANDVLQLQEQEERAVVS